MKVRFVPSVDDYIYLASKINTDGINNSFDQKAYTVFLSLNAVVAPAILLYSGYVVVGLAFFVVNVAIYLFVLHGMTERHYRKFYTQVTADLPATKVEVEITPATIIRSFDGDSLVITWKNISLIEERPESYFFFYRGGGISVRKSAFETKSEEDTFVNIAREYHKTNIK